MNRGEAVFCKTSVTLARKVLMLPLKKKKSLVTITIYIDSIAIFWIFVQGIEQFRRALEIEPHNVAANYGLASGLLGLSKDCVDSGAFGWGSSLLEVSLPGFVCKFIFFHRLPCAFVKWVIVGSVGYC